MDKKTLHKISYGLYIICSTKGDKMNGQIANAVFQVTSEPQTIAFSINKQNLTHEYLTSSKHYSLSILSKDTPLPFIGTFGFKSGRQVNKFEHIHYKIGANKTPIVLDHTLGYMEGTITGTVDAGTHTIFLANVTDAHILTNDAVMTYEYYHEVKGGYSPKTAPTYSKESDTTPEQKKEEKPMDNYVCTVCGYVYDPAKGDPDGGIAPGTAFEDIPDDWVCPVCGAGKDAFEKQ